jgi:hypothetical protein
MEQLLIETTSKTQKPDVPAGQRKCASPRCSIIFPERGSRTFTKLYCSDRCSRQEQRRRRLKRNPELLLAADRRKVLRYRAAHPEWAAERDRRAAKRQTAKRRAISEEDFEAQILAQGNRCPIGNHLFSSARGIGAKNPARDHCHVTDKWRGILCSEHNRALGMFHDSPEELQAALAYIREWSEKHAESA